jgi:hypothetical protein
MKHAYNCKLFSFINLISHILRNSSTQLYKHIKSWPDNLDSPEVHSKKEKAISAACFQYLASMGAFKDFT